MKCFYWFACVYLPEFYKKTSSWGESQRRHYQAVLSHFSPPPRAHTHLYCVSKASHAQWRAQRWRSLHGTGLAVIKPLLARLVLWSAALTSAHPQLLHLQNRHRNRIHPSQFILAQTQLPPPLQTWHKAPLPFQSQSSLDLPSFDWLCDKDWSTPQCEGFNTINRIPSSGFGLRRVRRSSSECRMKTQLLPGVYKKVNSTLNYVANMPQGSFNFIGTDFNLLFRPLIAGWAVGCWRGDSPSSLGFN